MKVLIVVRGLPGSGKSSLAEMLLLGQPSSAYCSADQFFMEDGSYQFDASKLGEAHADCLLRASTAMESALAVVVVDNTNTQEWEFAAYEGKAKELGYVVRHVIVENRHGGESVHNVPEDTVAAMRDRFEVRL